jgi:anti-sigma factor RsiW
MNENNSDDLSLLFKKHRKELTFPMPNRLKGEIVEGVLQKQRSRFSPFSWLFFGGGALAACASLLLVFQFGRMSARTPSERLVLEEVVSSHVRSLMAGHLSDVASTDQHTVKPWFDGKIDFAPSVKDFAKDGFPLIGGRLDYLNSRPVAALVYKFNQHPINVFEFPAATSESSEPRLQNIRGFQLFSWTKDGMSYWAVSDLNAAELQRFVYLWQ